MSQAETGDRKIAIDKDWSSMEIVNVGTGTQEEYEGIDAEGKIVLAAVNQWTENWIDPVSYTHLDVYKRQNHMIA